MLDEIKLHFLNFLIVQYGPNFKVDKQMSQNVTWYNVNCLKLNMQPLDYVPNAKEWVTSLLTTYQHSAWKDWLPNHAELYM